MSGLKDIVTYPMKKTVVSITTQYFIKNVKDTHSLTCYERNRRFPKHLEIFVDPSILTHG